MLILSYLTYTLLQALKVKGLKPQYTFTLQLLNKHYVHSASQSARLHYETCMGSNPGYSGKNLLNWFESSEIWIHYAEKVQLQVVHS